MCGFFCSDEESELYKVCGVPSAMRRTGGIAQAGPRFPLVWFFGCLAVWPFQTFLLSETIKSTEFSGQCFLWVSCYSNGRADISDCESLQLPEPWEVGGLTLSLFYRFLDTKSQGAHCAQLGS